MQRLLADLQDLCWRAHRSPQRLSGNTVRGLEGTLEALGASGEAAALPRLIYALDIPSPRVVAAAAHAATLLLALQSPKLWPRLDRALRRSWLEVQYGRQTPYSGPAAAEIVDRLLESGGPKAAVSTLAAGHCNGFVRQRALEEIDLIPTAEALPIVTIRLADWVDDVREVAIDIWPRLLARTELDGLISMLPLFHQLQYRRRVDADYLSTHLLQCFDRPDGRRMLAAGVLRPQAEVARQSLRWALALDPPLTDLLPLALRHRDAATRFIAARELVAGDAGSDIRPYLKSLADDPFSPIRHLSLDAYEAHAPEELEARARVGLLDRTASIRTRCQELSVLEFDIDPAPLYRDALQRDLSPTKVAAALFGLLETGDSGDRDRFESHVDAAFPRVRAAAVAGLARLADTQDGPTFFAFLRDPSPRVTRAAQSFLPKIPWSHQQLTAAYRDNPSTAGRLAAVQLSFRSDSWDQILLLLEASRDAAPAVAACADRLLRLAVFRRRSLPPAPSTEQRQQLLRSLESAGDQQRLVAEIRFMLRTAR